jgi:hypothetical protein
VTLRVDMKNYIKIECNFASTHIKNMVNELKQMKEILVIEFSKKSEIGHH